MDPKQIANQIYNLYWSAVNRGPIGALDPIPDIRPLIEKAVIDAEKRGEERERAKYLEKTLILDVQDRANMVAINFAGKTISSGDGTYDCLRYDVANAIRDIVTAAIKEEREACARLVELPTFIGLDDLAKAIRARSEGQEQSKGEQS